VGVAVAPVALKLFFNHVVSPTEKPTDEKLNYCITSLEFADNVADPLPPPVVVAKE